MAVRIGINGFGRIGRYAARLLADSQEFELVGVNARADNESLAHLLKYDSVHGHFRGSVEANDKGFLLQGGQVHVTRAAPGEWQWGELGADLVLETTGKFKDKQSCQQHLDCGAKKVLISAPGKGVDATIVPGVNDSDLKPEHSVISNASCTTNCLAPVVKPLHDRFGIEHGIMTTVHSYTMTQRILDGSHKDLRRARAAAMSMIPTSTGAAKAVTEVIPSLKGKLDGMAIRVPTPNVSLVDLNVRMEKDVGVEEINGALKEASEKELKDILGYSEEPLVSVDYNGSRFGGVVDAPLTSLMENRLLKVIVWYDNEAGFTHQLLRLAGQIGRHLA
ncbi:MAG: type I glyceraldehyde-3-phosphate dehydrogenase [Desulfohalobiaceae bacterium]|nr:type I glyceraldehyde-3-phosphate dehydrogenase [Desulfohalobiaceae bacterium]